MTGKTMRRLCLDAMCNSMDLRNTLRNRQLRLLGNPKLFIIISQFKVNQQHSNPRGHAKGEGTPGSQVRVQQP